MVSKVITSTLVPIKIVGSYFRDVDGWRRMKSLDRDCSEQRMLQTWTSNKNCRGRNFDFVVDRPQEITKNGKTWVWNLYGFKVCRSNGLRSHG
jgi:hypothetical protein